MLLARIFQNTLLRVSISVSGLSQSFGGARHRSPRRGCLDAASGGFPFLKHILMQILFLPTSLLTVYLALGIHFIWVFKVTDPRCTQYCYLCYFCSFWSAFIT